ncbi:MAG: hypothetical protein D6763_08020 [Alphaproteobacteria bacterium]|nr:MAG: hypothetical protein D6763_08020 [Alphaproteobacteria bacterium]
MGSRTIHPAVDSVADGVSQGLRHSQELATQLIRHLGVQGATQTCIENHWQGVLDIIRAMNHKQ